MPKPFALHAAFLAALILFALAPGIDLWGSRLAYRPGAGFWLAADPAAQALRQVFRYAGNLFGLAGGVLLALSLTLGPTRQVPARIWGFWLATMALGPGAAVNLVLKPLWGRARPADTLPFGGAHRFTPVLRWANECTTSCSFPSGEAAAAAGMALVLGLLLWPSAGRRGRIWLAAGLALYAAAVGLWRVALGRHFLSDITFGSFVALYAAWALYRPFGMQAALPRLTRAALAADAAALLRRRRS